MFLCQDFKVFNVKETKQERFVKSCINKQTIKSKEKHISIHYLCRIFSLFFFFLTNLEAYR